MWRHWRKFQTLILHDGNKVNIWRGVPGVTENCFLFTLTSKHDISDERVHDINAKAKRYCEYLEIQTWAIRNKMGPIVLFEKETSYVGRNGAGRMVGLEIVEKAEEGVVSLTPINTKGLANCNIRIPKDNLDEVIRALLKIKSKNKSDNG